MNQDPLFNADLSIADVSLAWESLTPDWSRNLEFRTTKRGYSILLGAPAWGRRFRKIGGGRGSLTWKKVAYWCAHDDIRYWGAPEEHDRKFVYAGSIEPWLADVLTLCWTGARHESFFIVSAEDIREIWSQERSLLGQTAHQKFLRLDDLCERKLVPADGLADFFVVTGVQLSAPLDAFRSAIDLYCDLAAEKQSAILQPFEEDVRCISENFALAQPSAHNRFADIGNHSREETLRNYLEHFVLEHRAIPVGVHDVPEIGNVDFSHLAREG